MEIFFKILIWLGQSILILSIFWFVVPSLVNTYTRNSWIKLPVMFFFAVIAGIFMAWLRYVPGILFFIWLTLTHRTIKVMQEDKFIKEADLKINKLLFYISGYFYVILACIVAYFFQADVVPVDNLMAEGIPLWKHLLGIK